MDKVLEEKEQCKQIKRNLKNKKEFPYMFRKTRSRREKDEEERETAIFEERNRITKFKRANDQTMQNDSRDERIDQIIQQLAFLTETIYNIKKKKKNIQNERHLNTTSRNYTGNLQINTMKDVILNLK